MGSLAADLNATDEQRARRRVLIIASTYRPAMLADMHRARMLAFDLPQYGWDVELLVPDASYQRPEWVEPQASGLFADAPVHEVPPWLPSLFRAAGIGTIALRAWWPLFRAGAKLLASGRFDLVYFSTTSFPLFCLGPLWQKRFGVPYVLDLQDPWYYPNRKYFTTKKIWKARISNRLAKIMERYAITRAAGLVAVSPQYLAEMRHRYAHNPGPWQRESREAVIPFAASERDLAVAAEHVEHAGLSRTPALVIRHVGVGGPMRVRGFEVLCAALRCLRDSDSALASRLRIELYGTAGSHEEWHGMLGGIAERHGVGDLVADLPATVSYRTSLTLAHEADGLLVLGVDDRGYTPSKLYNYLLFGKPVLAVLQNDSPATAFLESHADVASLITFGGTDSPSPAEAAQTIHAFLTQAAAGTRHDRRELLEAQLSSAMAHEHALLFDRCVGNDAPASIGKTPTARP
ncbi:MAG TPA: glycosyltransferase [Pirellulales bacterium]|nr:glycosyltransferase [Pirellulales bacterium]